MPAAWAAAKIVDPSAAVISRPSMARVTVPVRSGAVMAMNAVSAAFVRQLKLSSGGGR